MDVSEYRRQVEAEAEAAARREPAFKKALRKAGPSGRAGGGAFPSTPTGDDDLSMALGVIADSDATDDAFTAALQAMSLEVDDHLELIDTLLAYLGDAGNPPDRRLAVLNLLQEISFRMVGFPAKRPEYMAVLRSIIEDPDRKLRRVAIGILAREKDDYVQRRLVDGLEGKSKSLVPAAKAIQFLAYDVHSEYFPIARRIVENPPSQGAKVEAVRLLAADPSGKDLLVGILRDRSEKPEVKMAAAVALQSLDAEEFERQARRIVLDDEEDDQLRALSLNALTYFGSPAVQREDDELARRVESLNSESRSRSVKKATAGYLAKRGG
jgi:HEAT repeat protein